VAKVTDDLHFVVVYLLYGVDILRRGWIRSSVGAGIRDNLSWPDACHGGLVVDFAQTCAHRAKPADHVHRRLDFIPLWQIDQAWHGRHNHGRCRINALYRAAITISYTILRGLCGCRRRHLVRGGAERSCGMGRCWSRVFHRLVRHSQS